MNLITVCHLRKLAITSEFLLWNHWESSHWLQQITILPWIKSAIKWNLFSPSWYSIKGGKSDYSFTKAFRVPWILFIVLFFLMDLDMQGEVRKRFSPEHKEFIFCQPSVLFRICHRIPYKSTSSTFKRKLTTATWNLLSTVSRQYRISQYLFLLYQVLLNQPTK